ncbi:phosphotransferase enzyme family protein [Paenibacillus rigui]|uniref:Aminoglycoside phosphotransferase domain-containing protein n=1 Tax=Paenibacillus rigui TaxID=554312 RepID=A0A229UKF0_9BACL|nr:phosphotransferase [Paenibacillus rigui]OXM83876.1 hypothetical protein CF651_23480 [Paenibacillus rigui]
MPQIDDKWVREAGSRFAEAHTLFTPLESFESSVYAWARNGRRYVLKIVSRQVKTEAELLGEIDFVHFAAAHGVPVARAVASHHGCYVESVDDPSGAGYWVYAFEWAEGEMSNPQAWGPELFEQWGRLTGKLHRIASQYEPSKPQWKRHRWDEEELFRTALSVLAEEPKLSEALSGCLQRLKQLPEQPHQFGLIHNDLHFRNFHVHNGRLIVFDFAGMLYHHFVNDIAVALYYAVSGDRSSKDKASFAQLFMHHFMEGYAVSQPTPKGMLHPVPDWMLLRHLLLYTAYLRSWEAADRTTMQRWTLNRYRTDLLEGKLFGGIDFSFVSFL